MPGRSRLARLDPSRTGSTLKHRTLAAIRNQIRKSFEDAGVTFLARGIEVNGEDRSGS
jgi:hypothetical protein